MKVNYDEPRNYKHCNKKLYTISVSLPPKGTVVINKLEQAAVARALRGKTFFTPSELQKLKNERNNIFNTIMLAVNNNQAYVTNDNTPFVMCGTVGEFWAIDFNRMAQTYNFLYKGKPVEITNQTAKEKWKGHILTWVDVQVSKRAIQGENMACFVPLEQKGYIQTSWGTLLEINADGVSHGKGDFVICTKRPDGQPDLNDRWVVNGEIFATTYDNRGWKDCLEHKEKLSIEDRLVGIM